MRRDPLFEECLANVPAEVFAEVNLNIDIANRIADILHEKKMTQREFASLMGKRESEVSRWLTGSHGFTTKNPCQDGVSSRRGYYRSKKA